MCFKGNIPTGTVMVLSYFLKRDVESVPQIYLILHYFKNITLVEGAKLLLTLKTSVSLNMFSMWQLLYSLKFELLEFCG